MQFFVTGTDTDCGKTLVTSALLYLASQQTTPEGTVWQTLGLKPIASGCQHTDEGLRNQDALALLTHTSITKNYHKINPFSFEPAIAPHIAAHQQGVRLTPELINQHIDNQLIEQADFCLIEGAGGWRLPLGHGHFFSELVQTRQWPVILVVGMKLGCLNHALLTQEAIQADGLKITAWVANQIDPNMSSFEENLALLKASISAPLLGVIPYLAKVTSIQAAEYLSLPR